MAVTGLAVAVILSLVVGIVWGLGRVLNVLAPVVWPLAVAGVVACLLDPVVDFLVRRKHRTTVSDATIEQRTNQYKKAGVFFGQW